MKKIFLLTAVIAAVLSLNAEVTVPANAHPVQKRAAVELERYIEKILGIGKKYPEIMIGNTLAEKAGISVADLGNEGFVICMKNGKLYISAGTSAGRGVLYGVFEFLERQGCRFWTETEESVPQRESLVLPENEIREIPVFPEFRWIISGTCTQKWIMTGKLKLNGGIIPIHTSNLCLQKNTATPILNFLLCRKTANVWQMIIKVSSAFPTRI